MTLLGGAAEKHGHHYEDLWTIWQFVRMLHGQAESIRIEDPALAKVEFWVESGRGRELHQVKRQHASGKWTLHGLGESLIRAIGDHLLANNNRFVFVSGSDAPQLRSLCEAADGAESEREFQAWFLKSQDRKEGFEQLCGWWGCDVPTATDFLGRIEVHTIDQRSLEDTVRAAIPALFLARADTVATVLGKIVDDSVHRTWTRQELVDRLAEKGYPLRKVLNAESAVLAVQSASDEYLARTRKRLICGKMLPRPTTAALLSNIKGDTANNGDGTDNVVIGEAGSGKSACVVDLADQLRSRGHPTLAFRLDRVPPLAWKTTDLGDHLGLDESPALVLSGAAEASGRPGVLMVDQFDAVSTMSGRSPAVLDLVGNLIREVRSTRMRAPIHTVIVCRTFDWKTDSGLRRLASGAHGKAGITEFTITRFTTDEVKPILADAGFDPTLFRPRQLELLQLPQNLSVFLEADFAPSSTPAFDTATKLFSRYWEEKRQRVGDRVPSSPDQWVGVIGKLSEEITSSQQLSVAREKLDEFQPEYLGSMVSEGVLTFDGNRYGFGHESFFDYCFARQFIVGQASVVSFLTDSGQDLFRRAQVRQVLAYFRDADADRYVREVRELLADDEIRPHIKDLVLALLAEVPDPTDDEWGLWQEQIGPAVQAIADGSPSHNQLSEIARRRLFASPSWFAFLDEHRAVEGWLKSGNSRLVDLAVRYLDHHQRHSPDRVAAALAPYVDIGGDWVPRLRRIMVYAFYGSSRPFLDLLLRLLDNGVLDEDCEPSPHNHQFDGVFRDLIESDRIEWVPEVLSHRLRRRVDAMRASGEPIDPGTLLGYDEYAIQALQLAADESPDVVVEHLLPIVLDISDRDVIDETQPKAGKMWSRYAIRDPNRSSEGALLDCLAQALASLADSDDSTLEDVMADLRRRDTIATNHLLLALYRGGGIRYADQAVAVLCSQPWRLECGYADNPGWCAMESIRSVVPHCTAKNRGKLESMILSYRSPFEQTTIGYKWHGKSRFNLLSAFPPELRSDRGTRHYRELERKFGAPIGEPKTITGGFVGSPISRQATARMTDDQWLRAITRYQSEFPTHNADALLMGGAIELSRELGARTKEDPDGFARLALRIPADAHPAYIEEILRALEKAPASIELKISVCEKAFAQSCESSGSVIADVIGTIEEPLSDSAIEMLTWLATEHGSPTARKVGDETHGIDGLATKDLYTQGINTTRGRAAQALHMLILTDTVNIERFRPAIDQLIRDPSPAVRSCAAGMLTAVWHHDPQLGMDLFESLDLSEDRLLTTPHVDAVLRHTVHYHLAEARPIVTRMLRSCDKDIGEAGGRLAGLAVLYHESAADLVAEARQGGVPQRLGIAQVASQNINVSQYREWCEENLYVLFDDDDASVRRTAAGCFRKLSDHPLDQYTDLIRRFCESRAFQDHAAHLMKALKDSAFRLPGLTCEICDRFLERYSEAGEGVRYPSDVAHLVFRTYQHRQNDEWATHALDLIDRLCLVGDGSARQHFEDFER